MEKIVLAPYVNCGFRANGDLAFGFGSIQKIIKNKDEISSLLQVAAFLKTARTKQEIDEFLTKKELRKAFIFLKHNNGYLIDSGFLSDKNNRYHRQNLFFLLNGQDPALCQERLKNSHVVILGCGGIGNNVAVNLATAGVGKLSLIDADVIETTNLNRQFMFTEKDIGKSKIDSLKKALLERNSEISVTSKECNISNFIEFCSEIPDSDLLILSADTPEDILIWANQYSIKKTCLLSILGTFKIL